ncbi:hypothetical protein, partial [Pseudomonas aeruginosa]|uniref:hypothetical protein n=2 Tax=Pseudomonas aeruginosa TaxID=287 RepID=UPI001EE73DE9
CLVKQGGCGCGASQGMASFVVRLPEGIEMKIWRFALIFLILLFAVAWFSSSELRSHAVPWLIHWFEVLNR